MPVYIWQNAHPDFELLDDEELETLNYQFMKEICNGSHT